MVEEAPVSESSITEVENTEGLNVLKTQPSTEATIESITQGGAESTCNNGAAAAVPETSGENSGEGSKNSLELADEFMEKGSKALKDSDYSEAAECFSRALEIRVGRFGELSPECVKTYYKYGCALLYKAQEEADPLGYVPKKGGELQQESAKDESAKNVSNGESSVASASTKGGDSVPVDNQGGAANDVSNENNDEDADGDSDAEDLAEAEAEAEADDDESDLDLAWKMLDVARAIAEKQSGDTMEKVDILSTLAEVALEREDIETSLNDYQKALSMLERLDEADSRHIAELNFRICLCLEIGSQPQEAIQYCQKAISVCQARTQRLKNQANSVSESTSASSTSDTDKQAEIETLTGLAGDLEKKLEDLQQLVSNPKSILSEILGIAAAKSKSGEKSESSSSSVLPVNSSSISSSKSNGGFDSPTVSTTQASGSSGVTHLGVVGRGVRRVVMTADPTPTKKPALDSKEEDKSNGNSS
ncbi:uncharacterized protein LOC133812375 [Humulus lupulus]|uniref:uncharacterized protein LOC133812375 n=1 Tax=Humulus lupulus TaxID=3486 RepID=UPI002B407FDA|nr:uncharacterized protein LOC133812375 [Humulus lupulus]